MATSSQRIHLAIVVVGTACFTVGAATSARAANLVKNGGFEANNFSNWVLSVQPGETFVNITNDPRYVNSGNYGAFLGPIGYTGSLSQTLATRIGQKYELSYFLGNIQAPSTVPSSASLFQTSVNGQLLFDAANLPLQPLTRYSFNFVATQPATELRFNFRNDPRFFALDDVAVQSIPAPALLPGLIGLWFKLLQKRKQAAESAVMDQEHEEAAMQRREEVR